MYSGKLQLVFFWVMTSGLLHAGLLRLHRVVAMRAVAGALSTSESCTASCHFCDLVPDFF